MKWERERSFFRARNRAMRKSMKLIVLHKLWSSVYIIANILHFVCFSTLGLSFSFATNVNMYYMLCWCWCTFCLFSHRISTEWFKSYADKKAATHSFTLCLVRFFFFHPYSNFSLISMHVRYSHRAPFFHSHCSIRVGIFFYVLGQFFIFSTPPSWSGMFGPGCKHW